MNKNKSVLKRIKTNERNRIRNKAYKSVIKTYMKRFLVQVQSIDLENNDNLINIQKSLSFTYSKIDKAVKRNVIHTNNGARKKSLLSRVLKNRLVNSI